MWIHKINPSVLNEIYKGIKGKSHLIQSFHNLAMKCKQPLTKWDTMWTRFNFFQELKENKSCIEVFMTRLFYIMKRQKVKNKSLYNKKSCQLK